MKAVLFDLDGTLIDSAPQLVGALNQLRQKYDLAPIPFLKGRPFASHGAAGLLKAGFDMDKNDPLFDSRIEEFLSIYKEIFNQDVQCMEGIEDLIQDLNLKKIAWGIVTNKSARFTDPIVRQIPLLTQAKTVISGDTTAHAKPHPAPILEAMKRMGLRAEECVYIGDDERDIVAGKAAGVKTVAAGYGYLGDAGDIANWNADVNIYSPLDLLKWLPKT